MKSYFSQFEFSKLFLFTILILLFTSCQNYEDPSACLVGEPYGFLSGLWHGIIAPIDLIAMFFQDDVAVFAPNNNGVWYSGGFVLGSGGWGFLGGKNSRK